jgi:hypothetical protein
MMLDPITMYAAKVATTTTIGGALTAWSAVEAQTGLDFASAAPGAVGIVMLVAGVWKLLYDHTAVERERETSNARIAALEAEVAAAEARAREADLRLQAQREHTLRLGLDPDVVAGFNDHHRGEPSP